MKKSVFFTLAFVFYFSVQLSYSQEMWYRKTDFTGGERSGSVSFVINGKAYVGLGNNSTTYFNDFWKYDQASDTWTKIADFPGEARSRAIAFALNGKGYAGLGYKYGSPIKYYKDFYEYDPALNTWTKIDDFPGGERYGAVVFTIGESAYAGTGMNAGNYLKDFWKFTGGSWTQIADLSDGPRAFATGFSYETKGYIAGGILVDGATEIKNSMYAYNSLSGSWEEIIYAHSNLGFQDASVYVLSGKAWIMYGNFQRVLTFDPVTKNIENLGDLLGLGDKRWSGISFIIDGKPYFGLGSQTAIYSKDIWTFGFFNHPPTALSLSDLVIKDKCPIGTLVGTFSTKDLTVGDSFTYSLATGDGSNDADNALFIISGNELKTNGVIDFSVKPEFRINIKTTDREGASFVKAFSLSKMMYFEHIKSAGLPPPPPVAHGNCEWIDYNNDGFLDLIYANLFRLFKNNGNETYTEVTDNIIYPSSAYSIACHDFNNDGFIDLAHMCSDRFYLYINNCDGTFFRYDNTGIIISPYFVNSYLACADYDKDGLTDIMLDHKLYKNNGDHTFTERSALGILSFPENINGVLAGAWGDYNNDGWLDFVAMGTEEIGPDDWTKYCRLFKNNGNGTFSLQPENFEKYSHGNFDWGDYNNDGYLDLLVSGVNDFTNAKLRVYINNGGVSFTKAVDLTAKWLGKASWGDFDNDGYLDIISTGYTSISGGSSSTDNTHFYKNNKTGGFDLVTDKIAASDYHLIGDHNNDGKLDLVLHGDASLNENPATRLYKNIITPFANALPSPPGNLASIINDETATLSWNKASDAETGQNGLSYNIRIGISPAGNQVVPSLSDPVSGKPLMVIKGNCGPNTSYTMKLPKGTYYWSVQTIDGGFSASAWAPERTFTISASSIKLKQAISFQGLNYVYGDDPVKLKAYSTSGLPVTFSLPANSNVALENDLLHFIRTGEATITSSQPGNDSYEPVSITKKLYIDKKELKYWCEDIKFEYGTDPVIKLSYDGFVKNENETKLVARPSSSTMATIRSLPGIYQVSTGTGFDYNYTFTNKGGCNIEIIKRNLDITPENAEKEINKQNPEIKLKFTGLVNQHTADSLQVLPSIVHSVNENTPAGTYPISLTGGSDNRYSYVFHEGIFTVKPKSIETGLIDDIYGDINIYPVPFTEKLFIELPDDEPVNIEIINSQGGTLYKEKHENKLIEINTSEYQKGIYFIRLKTRTGIINTKVIK